MPDWLQLAADRHPDRVALQSGSRELTYVDLLARATAAARGLTAGVPVALEAADPFEFAVSLHACLLAGAPAVPIDPRLSESERAARAEWAVSQNRP
jgi:acyl-CoA synthetase (AMP-forming)/AMP-acid ligase II